MGFYEILPSPGVSRPRIDPATVRIGLAKRRKGEVMYLGLTIRVGLEIVADLGWIDGDSIILRWGRADEDGDDRGALRLERIPGAHAKKYPGGRILTLRQRKYRRSTLVLSTTRVPAHLTEAQTGNGPAEFTIDGASLELHLPDTWRAPLPDTEISGFGEDEAPGNAVAAAI